MKKLIALVLFAILISATTYAQTPTPTRKYEYVIVRLYEPSLGKNRITISYGNNREEILSEVKKIKIEGGKNNNINNVVDAFNYMDEQGYELVSTYIENYANGDTEGFQYVFRREVKK